MTGHQQRTGAAAPTVRVDAGGSAAGEPGVLRVHLRNVTTVPAGYHVQLLGLDDAWQCEPVLVESVAPDQTVSVDLSVTPVSGAAEGDYRFAVVVLAEGAQGRTIVETRWRVERRTAFVLSVEPAEVRTVRSKRVTVVVANSSSVPADAELTAVPLGEGVTPQLGRRRVRLAPHESISVPLTLEVDRVRFLSSTQKSHYEVRVSGSHAPAEVRGTVEQRSVVTPAMSKGLAVALALVVWIAGAIVGLPWLSDQIREQRTTVSEKKDQDTGGQDDTDGQGGEGGEGSGQDGEDEGEGAPGATGGATGIRISGAMEGDDVQGVRVDVSPASAAAANGEDEDTDSAAASLSDALGSAVAFAGLGRSASAKTWQWGVPLAAPTTPEAPRSTTTGEDGTWAFAGMKPTTRYLVVLSKPGYQTKRYLVFGEELAGKPLKVDLAPGRGSLSGVVNGPKGKVGGATVTISDGSTTLTTRTTTSGGAGRWSVDGLSTPGTYLVTAVSDELGAQAVRITLDAAGSRTVDLTLKRGVATLGGRVSGPLLSGGSGGIGGLVVTATNGDVTRTATTSTRVDDDPGSAGVFVLPALPVPGTYTVSVTGEGYLTQVKQLKLTTGKARSQVTFTMKAEAARVSGTVKDVDGTGLPAAGLVLSNDDNTYKTMSSSDGVGSFLFNGVAAGEYVLSATLFGYEEALARVEVKRSGDEVVHLQLPALPEGGLIAQSVIRGSTVDAATGAAIDCPDLRPDVEECIVTVSTTMRKPDGTTQPFQVTHQPSDPFQLPATPQLYPGRYKLTYSAPGYETTSLTVAVPMGATAYAATAALKQLPTIVGSVNTRVGTVPAGTCVIALRGGGSAWPEGVVCDTTVEPCTVRVGGAAVPDAYCAVIEANGSYAIKRMQTGTYRVFTRAPDDSEYVSDRVGASLTVVAGEGARRYDPTLDRMGRIAVTVLSSTGQNNITAAFGALVRAYPAGTTGGTPRAEDTSDSNGYAVLRRLDAGNYRITAEQSGDAGRSGELASVGVNLNQEIAVPLVMTSAVGAFDGSVVTYPSANEQRLVDQATVRISGVTGYNGLVPIRQTVELRTGADGVFRVCITSASCGNGGNTGYLPLVENTIDVTVEAAGYDTWSASGVTPETLRPITIQASTVCFNAALVFTGVAADQVPALVESVVFSVPSAPPGTGTIAVSAGSVSGNRVALRWTDSRAPTSAACPNGAIRPGQYVVQAALTGYDRGTMNIDLDPGEQMEPAGELELAKFGQLRVDAGVPGTVQTITLKDQTTRRIEADPGATFVDFGSLASGTYRVEVRAAGYRHETFDVRVVAGQTTSGDDVQRVTLTRLGTITGTVRANLTDTIEQSIAGATVTATLGDDQEFSTTTDAQGNFRITGTTQTEGLAFGTWQVVVTPPTGYEAISGTGGSSTSVTLSAAALTQPANLTLRARGGGLTLTVLDASSQRLSGMDVSLTYYDGSTLTTLRPDCVPGVPPSNPGCAADGTDYVFLSILPLNYTLTVTGAGDAPFIAEQSILPGAMARRSVQMASPAGSIQGTVFRQSGSVTQAVGAGVTVTLVGCTLTPASACTTTTNSFGAYQFASLPTGSYTVRASDGTLETQRGVQLGLAQSMVIDLTIVEPSSTVTVDVSSVNGYDLTGALVTLSNGTTTLGPQPAVLSSGTTYRSVFNQVPRGTGWRATVSGPAGHLGVYESAATNLTQASQTIPVSVTETRLRLRAVNGTPEASSPPASIVVNVGSARITVLTGDQETVHVRQGSIASVSADAPGGGWTVTGTGTSVASAPNHTATFTLTTTVATQLEVEASPTSVTAGGSTTLSATLTAGGNPLSGQSIVFERQTGGGGWASIGTASTDGSGTATTTFAPTATSTVRARFAGATPYVARNSDTVSITVTAATTP